MKTRHLHDKKSAWQDLQRQVFCVGGEGGPREVSRAGAAFMPQGRIVRRGTEHACHRPAAPHQLINSFTLCEEVNPTACITGTQRDMQPQALVPITHFSGATRVPMIRKSKFCILFCLHQSLSEAVSELFES